MGMRFALSLFLIPTLVLTACKKVDDESDTEAVEEMGEPIGSYYIDPESGEVRATHTDAAGVTTTMRAGEAVEARFPKPFSVYPDAKVANTTLLDQGKGRSVTIEFTTGDTREEVVRYYREQAESAGIEPDVEVSAGATTTLAGRNVASDLRFALQVTRVSALSEGQLTVTRGLD